MQPQPGSSNGRSARIQSGVRGSRPSFLPSPDERTQDDSIQTAQADVSLQQKQSDVSLQQPQTDVSNPYMDQVQWDFASVVESNAEEDVYLETNGYSAPRYQDHTSEEDNLPWDSQQQAAGTRDMGTSQKSPNGSSAVANINASPAGSENYRALQYRNAGLDWESLVLPQQAGIASEHSL